MSMVLTQKGKAFLLANLLNKEDTPLDLILHLFSNKHISEVDDGVEVYSEVVIDGYKSRVLWDFWWNIQADGNATRVKEVFTFNEQAGKIFGCYITSGTMLLGAKRFSDGPYVGKRKGDKLTLNVMVRIR